MATIDERIAALETKLKQERAKKQKIEARLRSVEQKRKRAEDTRRKILAGALVLELMEQDQQTKQKFLARLDRYLIRADDRALFGLSDITAQSAPLGNSENRRS
ncbi:mobilization protein [Azohydromonas caseinilytica]|uniref:Mobilization protein n=1 Tax=Azohydromonas caseinilytica TaxID=2728836 RepID=A0A848FI54_9BURK|nr:mobilization protein [Azohydromonas caseinilytica]NML19168.1 mobilization protein [Azohydromonas caseinilytica]